jgi:hypothetical protein
MFLSFGWVWERLQESESVSSAIKSIENGLRLKMAHVFWSFGINL